jgi:hypothetical protein
MGTDKSGNLFYGKLWLKKGPIIYNSVPNYTKLSPSPEATSS